MDIYDDFGPDATAPAPRKPSKARRARDDDDDDDFGLKPFATTEYPELEKLPPKVSKACREIFDMPVRRALLPSIRNNVELKRLKQGGQNLEAALAFQRGEEAESPCSICKAGKGPFGKCVTVDGYFKGACCNCHYGSGGSRCDFHTDNADDTPKTPTRRKLLSAKAMGKDIGGLHSAEVQKQDVEKAVDMGSAKRAEKRKELEYQMRILDKADKVEKRRSEPNTPTSASKRPRVVAKTPIRLPVRGGLKGQEASKQTEEAGDDDNDEDED